MGIIRTSFVFLLGAGAGAYLAQNYEIPNIKQKLVEYRLPERLTEFGVPEKYIERINGKSLTITDDAGVIQIADEKKDLKILDQKK